MKQNGWNQAGTAVAPRTETTGLRMLGHRRRSLLQVIARYRRTERVRAELAKEALGRLRAGSYGYCVLCGIRLPDARLEQRPEQPHCSSCERD